MLDCFSNGADQGRHLPEEVAERGSALQALSACRATLGTYRKCRLQGRHFRSGYLASGRYRPWSAPFGEAATGSAIGVPSKLGTYRKCRLQGRHFRSGY
ncbi:hypothetical protein, partial [Stenotrophomonas sp. AR026]|uniref:hypothetical protein n=1 Tax=Stenotrophomonas sp. AR026 TaxID=3398462 RepID=UPI003BAE15E9